MDLSCFGTGFLGYLTTLLIKSLLDLNAAKSAAKYLSILHPIVSRCYVREKFINLSGQWTQIWESAGSEIFRDVVDRVGHPIVKQLGPYCYAEFVSKNTKYFVFGRISGQYFFGDWGNTSDSLDYFGTFQLIIVDSNHMKGRWIGHSKTNHAVKGDEWNWTRVRDIQSA